MNRQINKQGRKAIINQKNKKINNIKETNKEINLKGENMNKFDFISNIDTKYRNELNQRMDLLMKKIDQNINNNNYNQLNMIIHNSKVNYINNYNNYSIPENIENEEKYDDNTDKISEEKNKEEEIKDKIENKTESFSSKIKKEENDNNEIINKLIKRNKFLENEVNYLKYKLNKVENQKNFIQDIVKKDTYIKRHLFDIFIVDYFRKIALNWKEVSNALIDELIIDEIHELTKVKLKLRHIKRIDEEDKKEKDDSEITPIDIEEFNLFNDNLKGIKQTIKSVKESERNLCKKYKIKIDE